MGMLDIFKFSGSSSVGSGLPALYNVPMTPQEFVDIDVKQIYTKILTDVLERTQGISEKAQSILWDNCLQSETNEGLVTLLAKAMACKEELFLVYNAAANTLRKADGAEQETIRTDYKQKGESAVGIYISFKKYFRTDMVKLYSMMEFCVVASLYKKSNLSKAIQYKMSKLRESVSLGDSAAAKAQAAEIAKALGDGQDVLMDGEDQVDLPSVDMEPISKSIAFLDAKRCFYLGMPMSYVNGEMAKGLGDSGDADMKAIERGLKAYYFSIIKPVLAALFKGASTKYKSKDFAQISTSLEVLKTFELIGDDLISRENKLLIVEQLLDLDVNKVSAEQDAPQNSTAPQIGAPTQKKSNG